MMKRLSIAVLPLVLIVSCSNSTVEEKLAKYNADCEAVEQKYSETITALQADSTLTEEEFTTKALLAEDLATKQLVKISRNAIRRNGDNEVALAALRNAYYMVEADELETLLGYMKGVNLEDKFVKRVSTSLSAKKATAVGMQFTDFEVNGVKFSDFVGKGKYVLVDFWASWCGPCKREIPNIAKVYETYAGDDFDVLSVAVWDKPEATEVAAKEHGVVWNQIVDAQNLPTDLYGIDGIPHIMLVGPDGKIVARNLRGDQIEASVKAALGK